jgi:hypothetical protein
MADPVQDGLVVSLARPGGNITGTTLLGPELVPNVALYLMQRLANKVCNFTAPYLQQFGGSK